MGWQASVAITHAHARAHAHAAGGEKLKKAKAAVAKATKDVADAETDAAKKAVQVRGKCGNEEGVWR